MAAERRTVILRTLAATAVALAYAVGCYLLTDWLRPDSGFVSITFAIAQPAAICSFVCYVADPLALRRRRFYALVPVWLLVGVTAIAAYALQEGVICIVMLAPIWIASGEAGALLTYRLRRRDTEGAAAVFLSPAVLALPAILMPVEAALPMPEARYTVTLDIVIAAPAEQIWPLMQGIPDVGPGEGRWNLTQDLLGVPRPLSARLEGEGVGSVRSARWEKGIAFDEIVTRWSPGRAIHWRFDFSGSEGWEFTDRHLRPDSAYMRILSGGYTLTALGDGRQRLRLETRYAARTPFNAYASLWGELFVGDLEANLLAAIRQRAEAGR